MKYAKLELGTVEAVFNKLGGTKGAQRFLRGELEVLETRHNIDCDVDPFVPAGWQGWEFHRKHGQLLWSPDKVALYLADGQKNGGTMLGTDLRQALEGEPVLNANVLDYLFAHPQLIPESWKGKVVFFWGTVYRDSAGGLCVRCLFWDGGGWYGGCRWLGDDFGGLSPAAVLASND